MQTCALKTTENLTPLETRFVEAVCQGMSTRAAFYHAGYTATDRHEHMKLAKKPTIRAAIQRRQKEMAAEFKITREDCVKGFLHAVKDAKLQADPMAQVAGWREIAKLLGHYEPEKKVVELSTRREEAIGQLQDMALDDLLALAGPDNAIDGEFVLVADDAAA